MLLVSVDNIFHNLQMTTAKLRQGEVAGLSVETVVQAVYMLEDRIMRWQRMQPFPGESVE